MRAIAEGLFTEETPPRLVGGRHKATGRIVFPLPEGDTYEPYPLRRDGRIWSYTIQRFRPKSPPYKGPEAFAPYAVAYVELPGETIVEGRLANVALDAIRIGMPVELTRVPLDPAGGDTVLIHAFEPKGSAA